MVLFFFLQLSGKKDINYSHDSDGDIWKSFGSVQDHPN